MAGLTAGLTGDQMRESLLLPSYTSETLVTAPYTRVNRMMSAIWRLPALAARAVIVSDRRGAAERRCATQRLSAGEAPTRRPCRVGAGTLTCR
jgi:hypothetical protein